jgi:hypothetical protein
MEQWLCANNYRSVVVLPLGTSPFRLGITEFAWKVSRGLDDSLLSFYILTFIMSELWRSLIRLTVRRQLSQRLVQQGHAPSTAIAVCVCRLSCAARGMSLCAFVVPVCVECPRGNDKQLIYVYLEIDVYRYIYWRHH